MSKKDLVNWGPVPGQLELDLDGDATGRDTHSGQHGDVFTDDHMIEFMGDVAAAAERRRAANRATLPHEWRNVEPIEIDQDAFVDYVHGGAA